ncbi:pyruvate/2-oxoglutarate dehydrogenase complex dihydrolipoamide dehydrogenase (E3) component [Arthrobacter pigmenti]|uniref:Pyruvate/2-oxoglutarate dehydrogenase complex dihydrolipoamide dehydrogenase (E3) component n=1 Tax=Arthrobacter pigmenti TaxID=271432 RepID=A0A846RVV4_9MICC|nr:FAD-dependent oxidoreductase [Arthrobacter pigmenti]NJC24317.1 pyruvate/2-oxoglutarate dehydrogenase complex dihydrolipoamide dehydrogenase (E3) component [Arthrobacter pigmenti]
MWDLVVIGGGTAGIVGSQTAAALGAKVLLIEEERTGGDCLYTGCVPSKALISAASVAAEARAGSALGIHAETRVDFPRVMDHVRAAIRHIEPVDSPDALRKAGVTVRKGHATLDSEGAVSCDGEKLPSRNVLIATGSSPRIPDVPGIERVQVLTNDNVWELGELPERLAVLGGGPVGCELAQAFARLGSEVTLIHSGDRLLPREDPDASAIVRSSLETDGVTVLTRSRAASIEPGGAGGTLTTTDGRTIPFTHLLVGTGRVARTAWLDGSAMALDDRGSIITDKHLRTNLPNVWAAGDVTANPRFTHTAGVHASIAATNAVVGPFRTLPSHNPRVTFTDPEVAAVGNLAGARSQTIPHTHVDRAVAQGRMEGFTRVVLDRRGRVVGGTVVGPRAGETLGEISLAVKLKTSASALTSVTHAYPTYNDGLWNAAIAETSATLRKPVVRRIMRLAAKIRTRFRAPGR